MTKNSQIVNQIAKDAKTDEIIHKFNQRYNHTIAESFLAESNIQECLNILPSLPINGLSNQDLMRIKEKLEKIISPAVHNLSSSLYTKYKFSFKKQLIYAFLSLAAGVLVAITSLSVSYGGIAIILTGTVLLFYGIDEEKRNTDNNWHYNRKLIGSKIGEINKVIKGRSKKRNNVENTEPSKSNAHQEFIKAQVKAIGDEDLHDIINRIRSTILLLPNDEEGIYLARLEAAQSTYNRHMDELETRDKDSEITLLLGDKLSYLEQFKTELSKIAQEINLKNLFISSENFNSEIARSINEFLENIKNFQDKDIALLELMNMLANTIKSDDLTQTLNITENFAICFWETIFLCNESEQENILAHLNPIFISAIVLRGEQKLDDMEQTLEVISIRQTLYQMKNSNNSNIKTYLRALVKYIESLEKKSPGRFRKK